MTELTARLALPLLQAGQAQKELFHNEALVIVDAALHAVAETLGDAAPPDTPAIGSAWIVGAAPVGAWAGRADALAVWTSGGWRFAALPEGALVWVRVAGMHARRAAAGWVLGDIPQQRLRIGGNQVVGTQAAAIPTPIGGATIDAEARSTLTAILNMLRTHGLIAS